MLENNQLDLGHAKVLLGASYEMQLKIANNIVESNLSVRATEELLKKLQTKNNFDFNQQNLKNKSNKNKPYNKQYLDPDLSSLQRKLSEMLGAKTTIEALNKNGSGKGKLIIEYNSLEELDGILEHFELIN
jgi:ParB family chromosome partitioning protein